MMNIQTKAFWAKPLFFTFAFGTMLATAEAPIDIRVALVIGNAAYPGKLALINPANDVIAMSAALKNLGFKVIEARDASRAQMEDAVKKLHSELKGKQGVGMLYYAGHGLQVGMRNYMVPVNAKLQSSKDVPGQTLDVGDVLDALKASGTRMNIVVLDACRDNPFADKDAKGLAPVDAPSGTFLAYATAPGSVADDGAGQNGLYTKHLLAELQKPVSIESVFKRVRLAVRKESNGRQIPWESTSLEEDFSFSSKTPLASISRGAQREAEFIEQKAAWDRIKGSTNGDDFYQFLSDYPSGLLTEIAQARLQTIVSAQSKSEAPRLDAKVAVPYLRIGDSWKTKVSRQRIDNGREYQQFEYNYTVQSAQGGENLKIVAKSSSLFMKDLELVVTPEGALVSYDQGSKFRVEYSPAAAQLPEGLFQVGRKFSTRVQYKIPNGKIGFDDFDIRVSRTENIVTSMGSFVAFLVERNAFTMIGGDSDGFARQNIKAWYTGGSRIPIRKVTEYVELNAKEIEETTSITHADKVAENGKK